MRKKLIAVRENTLKKLIDYCMTILLESLIMFNLKNWRMKLIKEKSYRLGKEGQGIQRMINYQNQKFKQEEKLKLMKLNQK